MTAWYAHIDYIGTISPDEVSRFIIDVASVLLKHSGPLFKQIRRTEKIDYSKPRPDKPRNVYDLLVHPLKPIMIVKQFEAKPFELPRSDDTFYWRSKKDWEVPFMIFSAFCISTLIGFSIWLYFELRPFNLPREPVDQSTILSRYFSHSIKHNHIIALKCEI